MKAMTFQIESVGVAAPGLPDWPTTQAVLRGEQAFNPEPLPKHRPAGLPANERRRASSAVRLAFQAAEQAIESSSHSPEDMLSVFASSGGDTEIAGQICTALTKPERPVSPTQFHNSVHNAPAGYWSIAMGAQAASTSIGAGDQSFVAGLLEAAMLIRAQNQPVLLVSYDIVPPGPLLDCEPFSAAFAVAMVLTATDAGYAITATNEHSAESRMESAALESVRLANPAARSLPLLELVAKDIRCCRLAGSQGGVDVQLV